MPTAAWITLILITGFVWGGFVLLLVTAFRKEGVRRNEPPG
jgi:hypothetical protein